MKRDFNLIRELMLYMNNYNCGCMLKKYTKQQIMYHTKLLKQAGYIKDGYFTDEGIRVLHLIDNKVLFDEAMEILKIKGNYYAFDILLMFLKDMHRNKMKKPIYKLFKPKILTDYKVLDLLRLLYNKNYQLSAICCFKLNSCHSLKNICIKDEKLKFTIGVTCTKFIWDVDTSFSIYDLLCWLNTIDINTSIYDIFEIDIIFEWHKYFNIENISLDVDAINLIITRDNKFHPDMVNSITNFEKEYIAGNNIV